MDIIYVRRCVNGKSFVASSQRDFPGLGDQGCPFSGEAFESQVKEVNPEKAEIMGINFDEAVAGIERDGLYYGRFRVNLGETMVIQ
jgi:hypothetical protein